MADISMKDIKRSQVANSDVNNELATSDKPNGVKTEVKIKGGGKYRKKWDKNDPEKPADVSFFGLFRYGDRIDYFLLFIGVVCSMGVGASFPLNFWIFSGVVDQFVGQSAAKLNSSTPLTITPYVNSLVYGFIGLSCATFVLAFFQMMAFYLCSQRQTSKIRLLFFKSILRQDIAWFDKHPSGELVTKLADSVDTIEAGIGDKLATFVQYFASFLGGFIMSFIQGWQLTLVTCSMLPVVVVSLVGFGMILRVFTMKELKAYSSAGSVAEEVLYAIRTVMAFGGEKKEAVRYTNNLVAAEKMGIKKGFAVGFANGMIGCTLFCSAALTFWYGSKMLREQSYNPGTVIQIFFCTIIGSISLGNALPCIEYFANARGAAANVFQVIERVPPVDIRKPGKVLQQFDGKIDFNDALFRYATRADTKVLENFNLHVGAGQTIALVGPSGSGKSTSVHLLQRFYDPLEGSVTIDGEPLPGLDLRWYRSQVGVVQQEPLLFAGTIAENIKMGRLQASQEEIEVAGKLANAHEFIQQLPQGYDTVIGEGGSGLSGGQKQRVAIARALVRRPRILLLDEATSALDTRSEKLVQAALDRAREGRTVIMIAHRLSTVRDADRILVIQHGVVVEEGSHKALMEMNGVYCTMVNSERKEPEEKKEEDDEEDNDVSEAVRKESLLKSQTADVELGLQGSKHNSSIITRMRSLSATAQELVKKAKAPSPAGRVFRMNLPECGYIIVGTFGAMLAGVVQPCFAILFSEIFRIFGLTAQPDRMANETSLVAGLMALGGFCGLIGHFLKGVMFGVAGERLTKRMRSMLFQSMLKQEIGWFDMEENQPGALTTRLATDASQVRAISGPRLGVIIEGVTIMGTSVGIAFAYSWKLTLVVLSFFPVIVMTGMLQARLMSGQKRFGSGTKADAGCIAQETLGSIRTVVSLGLEDFFYDKYSAATTHDSRTFLRKSAAYGAMNGVTQSILYLCYAASFALGAKLTDSGELEITNVFRVFAAISFGSAALGRAVAFAPDLKKSMAAASKTLAILDRKPMIDINAGIVPTNPAVGKIDFESVRFKYPTRSTVRVLRGLSLQVESGQTVALVGASGCGKSTLIQLVLRFYDPSPGQGLELSRVLLDGQPLTELQPAWLRRQMGLVSQEPVLFNRSIRDNIAYGDNTREDIPLEEIIEAAKQANIHDFIQDLPELYDTPTGIRGGQLSGGQKQRIAIARALLRRPTILLLDEATSALDNESEAVVQAALEAARAGRTCLVIAHRLSTVQTADLIAVVKEGNIVEMGRHRELMETKGVYYMLHNTEDLRGTQ